MKFKLMCAKDQLAVQREYYTLLPELIAQGLSHENSTALAHNVMFLFYAVELSPPALNASELLDRFSIAQIATICEEYEANRELIEKLYIKYPKPARRISRELK